jgi:hypothetical protein
MTEHTEGVEQPTAQPAEATDSPTVQQNPGTTAPPYVYAIGTIEPRFPSLALEKESAQATGRAAEDTAGLTDRETIYSVLSDSANRYLARQMCFVMTIQGLETYILSLRDPADLDLLVEAVRPAPRPTDVNAVIGVRGPFAPPDLCNGLMVPIVVVDQVYSFDVDSLIEGVPRPDSISEDREEQFRSTIEHLFYRTMQLTDNAGATDEHRALNYLTVRYPRIYERTAQAYQDNQSLTEVEARPSRLSGARKIIDVVFSYTDRRTDVTEKYFVRVDVTEEFPFLVTKLSSYYDR